MPSTNLALPIPFAAYSSHCGKARSAHVAGRALSILREMRAELREAGRIAAWLACAIVRDAGKDIVTLIALVLFLSGFVLGLDALFHAVLR